MSALVSVSPVPGIAGAFIAWPDVHADPRGRFVETYRREWFPGGSEMVQANRADRRAGCVVGLHYHRHQADYWYVAFGAARVVLHDLRSGSPTEAGTWAVELGPGVLEAENKAAGRTGVSRLEHGGVYIPPGVAHGFAALADCTLTYLVDRYYNPDDELGVRWDDPDVGADWGFRRPLLSERDQANPSRAEIPVAALPRWRTQD